MRTYKTCPGCKARYTEAGWNELPYIGIFRFPANYKHREQTLEMRVCRRCFRTITVDLRKGRLPRPVSAAPKASEITSSIEASRVLPGSPLVAHNDH